MTLWIITVNFGDTSVTKSLIDSLPIINKDFESIVIGIADNSASEKSSLELKKIAEETKFDVKIFSYDKNLYYWPAAKKVINKLKDTLGSYPDWLIVCNNDISFSDKEFFYKLKQIDLKKYPIIGPNIINSHGKLLNPFMISPLSKLETFYWKLYFLSYRISIIMLFIKRWLSPFLVKSKSEKIISDKKVYAVHGSAILFSNYFFMQGGWLDDNFEMYGEELTVAEIAKKLNLSITYYPELKITHFEHKSTGTSDKRLLFNKAKDSHKYFQSVYSR